jgi:membrane protease YdiL (CAAX protease family)
MRALIEPLLLYLTLFLPGTFSGAVPPELIRFSVNRELNRILIYNIPSFALIWYHLLMVKKLGEWDVARPRFRDLKAFLIGFPGLILTGFIISLISPLFTDLPGTPMVEAPGSVLGWFVMVLSCLSTGYLEETYFRFYLFMKFRASGLDDERGIFISVLFFSFCHMYEGPWGTLNAALAGFLLSFIFMKQRALHGIAFAHGLYNVFVYALGI